jgi:5-methylcytosine-specific restriction protein B
LKVVLLENIIPLLQEYFYGDWEKICLVLGCGTSGNGAAQTNASPVIKAEKLDEKEILGFDHLDYEDTWRYEVNPDFIGASGEGLQKFFFGIVSSKKSIGTQSAE